MLFMHRQYGGPPALRAPGPGGAVVATLLLCTLGLVGCGDSSPRFTSLPASRTGIGFTNQIEETNDNNLFTYQYMYNGAGVGLGDLDGDGSTDVFLVGSTVANGLYLNRGNWEFEDVAGAAGVRGRAGDWRTGVALADFNGDGRLDIYLCYSGNTAGEGVGVPVQEDRPERANELYVNNGPGPDGIPTFTERAAELGLDARGTFSSQAYVFDYDRDGDLDLFLVNHANMFNAPSFNLSTLRNQRHPYFGNRLYRNDGGRFTDVSDAAGIHGSALNYGLSASITDFDGDGWPDVFVTNDYDEQDFLYLNRGDGTFREVSHTSFGHLSKNSMGSDVADINNDGRPDLFVADMLPADNRRQKLLRGPDKYDKYQLAVDSGFHHQNMRNVLQLNEGTGPDGLPRFREIGQLAGVATTDWSWATLFADFDNDTRLDLYVTNGYLRDYTNMDFLRYAQDRMGQPISSSQESRNKLINLVREMPETRLANYLFTGTEGPGFTNRTKEWQLDEKTVSNGAAYGDLDGDGDLDLVVNNLNQPVSVWRNDLGNAGRHHLRVKLEGRFPNSGAVGTVAEAAVGGTTLRREAYYVRGYQSSVEPVLTFGLGEAEQVDELRITWPDQTVTVLTDVAVDQTLTVTQEEATTSPPPPSVAAAAPEFEAIGPARGIDFVHRENDFIDFKVQRLIPYQPSRLGGTTAAADVNGDGRDDIYFGGALRQAGRLYLSTGAEGYRPAAAATWEADAQYEDMGSTFFDADGDGDLDLYVVSGGNERAPQSKKYQDRLYLNDGTGEFRKTEGVLPTGETGSGGRVIATDYDRDGDTDLFVAGRVEPQTYPLPPRSYLLRNESGPGGPHFVDVAAEAAPGLSRGGMVTDATWTDLNGDGWEDLLLVGEWMPVTVYLNDGGGGFRDATEAYGLADSFGWWSSLAATDVDGDGDTDYLLGNAGTNHQYAASREEPLEYFIQDLNGDAYPDPVMSYYLQGKRYPVPSYDEMADQMASFRKRFGTYTSYAEAGTDEVLALGGDVPFVRYRINELRSGWLERSGDSLLFHPLPAAAQVSVINAFPVADFDGDGREEILAVGNFYPYRVEWGPSDALRGAFFTFRDGQLVTSPVESPLPFSGDIRDARILDPDSAYPTLLVTRNDGPAALYGFRRKVGASDGAAETPGR
ncbi:VCBS repeat-containing protein [Lewinella sp. IMCC34183]|uniref:VCBS repeat-containing protein n=1 Tax=Lewinella sp. IMCC34183 TaxID=2248762 RepID=UPI000E2380D4|nr:VCBS repeat-containing protein [Lewinella sp. IMCC34183]